MLYSCHSGPWSLDPVCAASAPVKSLRIFLLVLLALLLPVRGAVAATMVCATAGQAGGLAASAAHGPLGLHTDGAGPAAGHLQHAVHAASDHPVQHLHAGAADGAMDGAVDGASEGAGSDSCPICASGCGLTALLTAVPCTVGEPLAAQAPFPGVAVPALDFQLDGLDRPPRTI